MAELNSHFPVLNLYFIFRLPDYDHEISVFDYYVDESGEWDTWIARVPEATYTGSTDMLGEVRNLLFVAAVNMT